MNTRVAVLAVIVAALAVLALVLTWRKSRAVAGVLLVGLALILVAGGAWLALGRSSHVAWVDSSVSGMDQIKFSAPDSSGSANGSSFWFTSGAQPKDVFDAFKAAYPSAVVNGNVAAVTVAGHVYTLTYFPSDDPPHYMLANDLDPSAPSAAP